MTSTPTQPCCSCPHELFPLHCKCRCHILAYCQEQEMSPTEMLSYLLRTQHLTLAHCGISEQAAERILKETGWMPDVASAEF